MEWRLGSMFWEVEVKKYIFNTKEKKQKKGYERHVRIRMIECNGLRKERSEEILLGAKPE